MKEMGPRVPTERRMELSYASAPAGFTFPASYRDMAGVDTLPDIAPMFWMFDLEVDGIADWTEILAGQFPERVLVPFAKYGSSDDVYCFDGKDMSGNPIVLLIHSFTDPGWEYRGEWSHFDSWLSGALEHHQAWLNDELEDFHPRESEDRPLT